MGKHARGHGGGSWTLPRCCAGAHARRQSSTSGVGRICGRPMRRPAWMRRTARSPSRGTTGTGPSTPLVPPWTAGGAPRVKPTRLRVASAPCSRPPIRAHPGSAPATKPPRTHRPSPPSSRTAAAQRPVGSDHARICRRSWNRIIDGCNTAGTLGEGWGRAPQRRGPSRAMKPCTCSAKASSRGASRAMSSPSTGSSTSGSGGPHQERSPSLSAWSHQFLQHYHVE
jgi:hypothetical protein